MPRSEYLTAASCAVLAFCAFPAKALAQQTPQGQATSDVTPAEQTATIDDIIVTANKREESANTVPMSITAATGEVLARQGIQQIRDLVKITPSFTYADSYVGSPIYTLRGVGFSDISLGGRPTVSIYVDEAPLPFSIETRGANLDVERVEILKGPQGTLFGQNATGGAINYIAAKPTKAFTAGADLGYGSFNAVQAGGFISGPLSDTLSVRLAVDHTQNDGWQKSYVTGAKNGADDFTNARILLAWAPTDRFKAQVNLNGYQDRSDVQAGQLIAISPGIPAAAGFVPGLLTYPLAPANARAADWNPGLDYGRHNTFVQGNLRLDYALTTGLTLTSITSYSHYDERQLQDADGTTLSNLSQLTLGKIKSLSQELRVAGGLGEGGHFVTGFTYSHDKVDQTGFVQIGQSTRAFTFTPFGLPLFTSFSDSERQDIETTAAFASADYQVSDRVKVYGGLRYTRALNRFSGCTADTGDGVTALDFGALQNVFRGRVGLAPNPPIPAGGCITSNAAFVPGLVHSRLDEGNLSWRAGAEWTPADRILLYANLSKGYKAGGFPDLPATQDTQFRPAMQESLLAYEAGFKATLAERTVQLNGAVFYYDYTDKQILGRVSDPVFGPLLALVNVPKSEIKGAELQATWAPIRGMTVSVGGSYIASRVLDHFTNYDPTGALVDFHGEAFPNTPKWQFVSDIDYRRDLVTGLIGFVGGGVTYQSPTNSQLGELPQLKIRGYALVDLRAGVETTDGAWRLMAWGRNVGGTYYWTTANINGDTTVRFAGRPASYGLTLSYKYR